MGEKNPHSAPGPGSPLYIRYIYIYIYIYVYATAHRVLRVGCDWSPTSAFRLLLSDFCLLLIIGAPLNSDGQSLLEFQPPPGRSLQISVLLYVLANIAYFAPWIYLMIHQNLICCSMSLLKHSFPLFYKYVTSENLSISKQCCKSRIVEKRIGNS